jgi:hypothetical protein
MVADRAYSPGLLASTDRRTSLFYFAAAVPTVGFVHGPADLNPLNAATLEGYAEGSSTSWQHSSSRLWPSSLRWRA